MFELRQFNLKLAFMALGTLRKDIQDKRNPVNYTAAECNFEIALLRRRQLVIENDEVGFRLIYRNPDLFHFSGSCEVRRVRPVAPPRYGDCWYQPCAVGKQPEFFQTFREAVLTEIKGHQDSGSPPFRAINHVGTRCGSGVPPANRFSTFGRRRLELEIDRTRGHDGRNRVLVDHLRDRVSQQHDILVERFDLPLQLYPVHKIN